MAGMTIEEALGYAKNQYIDTQRKYEEAVNTANMMREALLRQEGYIMALEQVVEGKDNGKQETVDSEGSRENGKEGHEGEFASSLKRARRRADSGGKVSAGVEEQEPSPAEEG